MSGKHQECVAAYRDVSSVYSYGYGALREACRQFDADLISLPEFTSHWHEIVAAVEFRAAEIGAEVLAENIKVSMEHRSLPYRPAPDAPSEIYSSDETAGEKPTDE